MGMTNNSRVLLDSVGSGAGSNTITSTLDTKSGDNTFAPAAKQWNYGNGTESTTSDTLPGTASQKTAVVTGSAMGNKDSISYQSMNDYIAQTGKFNGPGYESTDEELKRLRMPSSIKQETTIRIARRTAWQDPDKKREMLNEDISNRQNESSFPYYIQPSSNMLAAKYDYQIIPGDFRYSKMASLESKLQTARASLGIHVHGNNDIARAVEYYTYNRFKVPDYNLAFNRMTTHVFFTRPDLNLLDCNGVKTLGANSQIINHSEAAMIYRTHPYLFKLLTDNKRCGDSDNFNLLLSNRFASFDINDENLTVSDVGKTWGGFSIPYGDGFDGNLGGEFSCTFNETQDLDIITMMKLWTMYIYNVSRGAWKPSYDLLGEVASGGKYNLNSSHVFTKTLDYGASVYVFKCAPDGETVLYWEKYFGVFPVNTGASALSWSEDTGISAPPKLNIKFRYAYKKTLSPISLVEFNEQSSVGKSIDETYDKTTKYIPTSEASFNPNYNHSSRPFVGAPFIEMKLATPGGDAGTANRSLGNNADIYGRDRTHIRLKYLPVTDPRLSDEKLYRSSFS